MTEKELLTTTYSVDHYGMYVHETYIDDKEVLHFKNENVNLDIFKEYYVDFISYDVSKKDSVHTKLNYSHYTLTNDAKNKEYMLSIYFKLDKEDLFNLNDVIHDTPIRIANNVFRIESENAGGLTVENLEKYLFHNGYRIVINDNVYIIESLVMESFWVYIKVREE